MSLNHFTRGFIRLMDHFTFELLREILVSKGFLLSLILIFVDSLRTTNKVIELCSCHFIVSFEEKLGIFARTFLPTVIGSIVVAILFSMYFESLATALLRTMEFPLCMYPLGIHIANKQFSSVCDDAYYMICDSLSGL